MSRDGKYLWNLVRSKINVIISLNKAQNKFLAVIEILKMNPEVMLKCHYEILCISRRFPPQKNEYKFAYGKLIEKALIRAFSKIGFNCSDLDEKHKFGSEYKNDINLLSIDISIKAKLNKGGNIILINKKSTASHDVKVETLLCIVNEGKIVFIPSIIVNNDKYVAQDAGCISYKSSLVSMIYKNLTELIYSFPEITEELQRKVNLIKQKDLYKLLEDDLFNDIYTEVEQIKPKILIKIRRKKCE